MTTRLHDPWSLVGIELGGGTQVERYLRKAGLAPRERFELSSLVAKTMLVDRGLGVALAPDAATREPKSKTNGRFLKFKGMAICNPCMAVWSRLSRAWTRA